MFLALDGNFSSCSPAKTNAPAGNDHAQQSERVRRKNADKVSSSTMLTKLCTHEENKAVAS
jgi:hypothetical protein